MISTQSRYNGSENFGILKIPVLNMYRNLPVSDNMHEEMNSEDLDVIGDVNDVGGDRDKESGDTNDTKGDTNDVSGDLNDANGDSARSDLKGARGDTNDATNDLSEPHDSLGALNSRKNDLNNISNDLNDRQHAVEPNDVEDNRKVDKMETDIGLEGKEVGDKTGDETVNGDIEDKLGQCFNGFDSLKGKMEIKKEIEATDNEPMEEGVTNDANVGDGKVNKLIENTFDEVDPEVHVKVENIANDHVTEVNFENRFDRIEDIENDAIDETNEPCNNKTKYSRPWMSDNEKENCVTNDRRKSSGSPKIRHIEREEHRHEKFKCNSYNPEFEKTVKRNRENLMKFAETLFKCKLCLSIPSILTSKESFLNHVKQHHLTQGEFIYICRACLLKFRTEEDLNEHVSHTHTGSDKTTFDQTGSDVIESHDHENESNNDSDSDSSGHRQHRAKIVKRSKPVHDFENPKQLVDHTGIETWNGSLDLSKKSPQAVEKCDAKTVPVRSPKKDVNDIAIKQITEQIIKSDVQCRNQNKKPGQKLPFIPSSTPEFGKYTKLVREGGNIVYFCQICNWKSPIKTTFQVHCNTTSHKNKVANADNPDSEKIVSEMKNAKSNDNTETSPINSGKGNSSETGNQKSPWSPQEGSSYGQKFPDQSLFYNYIVQTRGLTPGRGRTPVVSPYGNRSSVFQGSSQQSYKRSSENPVDLAMKKRKKNQRMGGSRLPDSDSDDEHTQGKDYSKQSNNNALLRNKLFSSDRGKHNGSVNGTLENDGSIDLSIVKRDSDRKDIAQRSSPFIPAKVCDPHNLLYNPYLPKPVDHNQRLNKCHACSFEYSKIEDYERHFDKVHKSLLGNMLHAGSPDLRFPAPMIWPPSAGIQSWMEAGSQLWQEKHSVVEGKGEPARGKSGDGVECEMGENWRVQKLKELLPDFVIECEKGNTSRDNLLQCISSSTEFGDAMLWSSACNRAIRELYPNSQAQRKGKYKKTFYFGISMLDAYQSQEDNGTVEGETNPLLQLPPRDISMDMERIVEHLPTILKWTGCMDSGVHRQELLAALGAVLQDPDAMNWGAQCNRAIRLVFPLVDMKRKGKYKATMYLGVEFQPGAQRILSHQASLELFNLPHPAFHRVNSPLQLSPDYLRKQHEDLKRAVIQQASPQYRGGHSNSPIMAEEEMKSAIVKASKRTGITSPTTGTRSPTTGIRPPSTGIRSPSTGIRSPSTGIRSPSTGIRSPISPKTEPNVVFSESIRKDAEKEMEEYLLKFGGIPSVDAVNPSPATQPGEDNENDGDDEGDTRDSGL